MAEAVAHKKFALNDIALEFLKRDPRFKSTLIQIYSSAADLEVFSDLFLRKIEKSSILDLGHPLTFMLGAFEGLEVIFSHSFQYVDDNERKLVLFNKLDSLKLPTSKFLVFASPVVHLDGNTNADEAKKIIAVVRTLMTGLFGRGLFLDLVTEFDISGEGENKSSFGTKWIRVPQPLDFRALPDYAAYSEIVQRLGVQIEPLRSRIATACRFFDNALLERFEYKRFFDYWTALEIVCDGKSQAIRTELAKAYDSSIKFVDDNLKFKVVSDLRHDLIHNGKFYRLEPDVERRMQSMFLDILRSKLNLSSSRFTERLDC